MNILHICLYNHVFTPYRVEHRTCNVCICNFHMTPIESCRTIFEYLKIFEARKKIGLSHKS
ncbi:hypothetical protein KC19_11G109900 [Ceratodon purpureus]|uniref:Uncharacterized protein n=1 Tax=Ceratodon purpureus TaxID=3225 RepID=A0A8T0GD92_CERPU|nr:hypothetical protein KC19_11G109900 [Ceratodon purpureus]